MKSQKVLFLGCNMNQISYLKACRTLGLTVIATDINQEAPGVRLANKYYKVNYEDHETLIEIGKVENFTSTDFVFTAADQFAYLGASKFAEHFGIKFLPPKTAEICGDKALFSETLESLHISTPKTKRMTLEKIQSLLKHKEFKKPFFIKSDYCKGKKYLFKIDRDSANVDLPKTTDRYFRRAFVVQDEVKGNHFRVNWFCDNFFYFSKITDSYSFPIHPLPSFKVLEKDVLRIIRGLKLTSFFVKFDVVINSENHYIFDIGLNVPIRYAALYKALKQEFEDKYIRHLLFRENEYLENHSLIKPILIKDYEAQIL